MNDSGVHPEVATEVRDVSPRSVLGFVGALVILLALAHLLIWPLFTHLEKRAQEEYPSPFPLAESNPLPPEPRLEGIDRLMAEVAPVRPQNAAADLSGYGWVNEKAGVVRIPLDTAMKLVVQENAAAQRKSP